MTHTKATLAATDCLQETLHTHQVPRKPYCSPAIVYETRLQTRAGSPIFFDDPFGSDPERAGKGAQENRNDGSTDPARPPDRRNPGDSGNNQGEIDPARPQRPSAPTAP